MGNCIDYQKKPVSWVDLKEEEEEEEWAYESAEYRKSKKAIPNARGDDEDLLRPLKEEDFGAGADVSGATEIKIKISKKQLEKMLQQQARHGGKGGSLRLQQVLEEMMSFGEVVQDRPHGRHWRPKLQSIAE